MRRPRLNAVVGWLALAVLAAAGAAGQEKPEQQTVRVGSKSFTESVVLGEIVVHLAEDLGYQVEHVRGVGGTQLVWQALLTGQIDVYAEYTGTMILETLSAQDLSGDAELRDYLRTIGLELTAPIGFNNTYRLGMKRERAAQLGITKISDLVDHPQLSLRFSPEFMQRADGWRPMADRYQLPHNDVRGLEHALSYAALDQGAIDVTDLYATDAKIEALDLTVLEDDLGFFPEYNAVYVYRADLKERAPDVVARLHQLEGALDERDMIALNAQVEIDGDTESVAAARLVRERFNTAAVGRERDVYRDVLHYTLEHINMVAVSLLAAVVVSIPLGVIAAKQPPLSQPILGVVGMIQTIPSIALLVLLIKPISYVSNELGYPQAVVALFLYSLLPIVRNTHAGLTGMAPAVRESALALGLPMWTRLWKIELPLASRTILAGVKTAAVINVGFATLGGFIGAGGYGQPIFEGIRLYDYGIMMRGAIPAALLALAVQGLFEVAERVVVPRGLRLKPSR